MHYGTIPNFPKELEEDVDEDHGFQAMMDADTSAAHPRPPHPTSGCPPRPQKLALTRP